MSASVRSRPSRRQFLADLGLHGLAHLDAPVLAALATETPLLLIGPHGSAKSALLGRLAAALGLEHRHYNASLISFDDLVGFPVPDGDGLKYLRTPGTLWEAESVFLDEISRCRPEVQNKLFSIVHEKRVQGLALPRLRYRWAAMNPPATADSDEAQDVYLGSMPLDPALADRFGFVLPLPALEDLSPEARLAVIRSGLMLNTPTPDSGLAERVKRCQAALPAVTALHEDWISAYVAALVVPLVQAGLTISGRRAAILAANIAGVVAAFAELGTKGEIEDAALCALRHSMPQRAQGKAVDNGTLTTVHRKAVDAAGQGDSTVRRILGEARPVKRVGMALAALRADPRGIPRSTMSLLVCDALASQDKQGGWVLAQLLLPALAELDCVDAATFELLAEPFEKQLQFETSDNLQLHVARSQMAPFNELVATMGAFDEADPAQAALGNLGAALYSDEQGAARPAQLVRQQAAIAAELADGGAR